MQRVPELIAAASEQVNVVLPTPPSEARTVICPAGIRPSTSHLASHSLKLVNGAIISRMQGESCSGFDTYGVAAGAVGDTSILSAAVREQSSMAFARFEASNQDAALF